MFKPVNNKRETERERLAFISYCSQRLD